MTIQDYEEYYGTKPLPFNASAYLPENVIRTHNNKVEVVDICESIIHYAKRIENTARLISESDDERHSKRFDEIKDKVKEAFEYLEDAIKLEFSPYD